MAPRNNDANPSYKKNCPSTTAEEDDDQLDMSTYIPSLLHKKHKVVKLVKAQMKKIHEEGLLNNQVFDLVDDAPLYSDAPPLSGREKRAAKIYLPGPSQDQPEEVFELREHESNKGFYVLFYLLAIFFFLILIILLAVWISAGPLSNPMAYTPIPPGSFVRTDGLCSLEKKYLLRWSKPEYV